MKKKGFTLVEVLIATLLFAIAAQGLVTTVVNALTAINSVQKDANRDSEERFILRQLLQIEDEEALDEGGEILLPDDSKIYWSAEHDPTNIVDLHKVSFEIRKSGRNAAESENYTLSIYLLRPWLSESSDREFLLERKEAELERMEFRAR